MKISVITSAYNEVDNIQSCAQAVRDEMLASPAYDYEHIFADNASTDGTDVELRALAANDPEHIRVIFNEENVGGERSMLNAMLHATGDLIVAPISADLQDPPPIIRRMLAKYLGLPAPGDWFGNEPDARPDAVAGVRTNRYAVEGWFLSAMKTVFYRTLSLVAPTSIPAYAGVHMITRGVLDQIREFSDYAPFLRVQIPQVATRMAVIEYAWQPRLRGVSKNDWRELIKMGAYAYRVALLGPKWTGPVKMREIDAALAAWEAAAGPATEHDGGET